jgi:5-methylcytosine-specific restriction endonuclease McrA
VTTNPQLPDQAIRRRCRRALASHRRRAKADHAQLDYRAEDLEQLARDTVQCAWCKMPVGYGFHFDHERPTSRGGPHALSNIMISCSRCNRLKGPLAGDEMRALLALLASVHPAAAADLSRRLLAGGRQYRRP